MNIGFSLSLDVRNTRRRTGIVMLTMSGLDRGVAVPGRQDAIRVPPPPGVTWVAEAWGRAHGDTTFGSRSQPADYSELDGATLCWEGTGDNGAVFRAAAPVRYPLPSFETPPVVTGATGLGAVLTVSDGTWTAPGASIERQWRRDGGKIPGSAAASYVIGAADAGTVLDCLVTATSSGGTTAVASNGIQVQAFAAPVLSGAPSIAGTAMRDQTLAAVAAAATGMPAPLRSWQWLADGTAITGATTATYVPGPADLDRVLTVVQTETNALGAASAESAATGPVVDLPAPVGTGPEISITSFDEVTDSGTLVTDAPNEGSVIWATVENGVAAPVPDGAGGWTGTVLETGSVPVGASGDRISFPYSPATGDGPRDLYLYQRTAGAADSNVAWSGFTADSRSPVLSVTATPGDGTLTVAWSTDEDGGSYHYLLSDQPTAPQVSTILAAPTGSGTITAAGAQPAIVEAGLTNGVSRSIHLVQRDARGNTSAVATATATPVSATTGSPSLVPLVAGGVDLQPTITTAPVSSSFVTSGTRPLLVAVFLRNQAGGGSLTSPDAITLTGGAAPLDLAPYRKAMASDGRQNVMLYLVPAAALGSATYRIAIDTTGTDATNGAAFGLYEIAKAAAAQTGATASSSGSLTASSQTVAITTTADNSLVVYAIDHQSGAEATTATKIPAFDMNAGSGTHRAVLSFEEVATSGTLTGETFTWATAVGGRALVALEVLS